MTTLDLEMLGRLKLIGHVSAQLAHPPLHDSPGDRERQRPTAEPNAPEVKKEQ